MPTLLQNPGINSNKLLFFRIVVEKSETVRDINQRGLVKDRGLETFLLNICLLSKGYRWQY